MTRVGEPTVADLADLHLERSRRRVAAGTLAPSTLHSLESLYRASVREHLGARPLRILAIGAQLNADELRRRHGVDVIEAWHAKISKKGPVAANRAVQALRAAWPLAERARWVGTASNPFSHLRGSLNAERPRLIALTVDQSAALLAELRRVEETSPYLSQRYAAQAIQLLALSGARREEIFGLEWQDVAEDCLELALRRTKTGPRTLCLGAEARHVLARVPKQPGESQVFPGANYRSVWWPVRSAVGLPKLHLHDLRCTFSTRLHEAGVPIQHIAAALGQRTVSVNVKYYMSLSAETMAGIANLGSRLVASQTKEGVTK